MREPMEQSCRDMQSHHARDKLYCKGDCLDCDYYRQVHLQATNVMVVTDDSELIASLDEE